MSPIVEKGLNGTDVRVILHLLSAEKKDHSIRSGLFFP